MVCVHITAKARVGGQARRYGYDSEISSLDPAMKGFIANAFGSEELACSS